MRSPEDVCGTIDPGILLGMVDNRFLEVVSEGLCMPSVHSGGLSLLVTTLLLQVRW